MIRAVVSTTSARDGAVRPRGRRGTRPCVRSSRPARRRPRTGATPGSAACRDLRGDALGDRPQRVVAHVAEALVAFLRGEVARPQHGAVVVPVARRSRRRADAPTSSPSAPAHGRSSSARSGARLSPTALGEREHRLFDVAEVLVEGRRRRADRAGDVDDPQIADPVRLEQPRGRVEQPAPGLRAALAERPPVERDRRRSASAAGSVHPARSRRTPTSSLAGRNSARTRMPIARVVRRERRHRRDHARARLRRGRPVATTNGTRSLNGGTPFWRITVNE